MKNKNCNEKYTRIINRVKDTEGQIRELEDRVVEITDAKQKKE